MYFGTIVISIRNTAFVRCRRLSASRRVPYERFDCSMFPSLHCMLLYMGGSTVGPEGQVLHLGVYTTSGKVN